MFKAQPDLGPGTNLSPEYQKFKTKNWKSPEGCLWFSGTEIYHNYFCNSVNVVSDFPACEFMGIQDHNCSATIVFSSEEECFYSHKKEL